MSDNQYVFEIIRDVGYAIQRIPENETLWMSVKNDGNGFYTARGSDSIVGGLSETSRAIEKAYKVTRGQPDPRDKEIERQQAEIDKQNARTLGLSKMYSDECKRATELETIIGNQRKELARLNCQQAMIERLRNELVRHGGTVNLSQAQRAEALKHE